MTIARECRRSRLGSIPQSGTGPVVPAHSGNDPSLTLPGKALRAIPAARPTLGEGEACATPWESRPAACSLCSMVSADLRPARARSPRGISSGQRVLFPVFCVFVAIPPEVCPRFVLAARGVHKARKLALQSFRAHPCRPWCRHLPGERTHRKRGTKTGYRRPLKIENKGLGIFRSGDF